MVVQWATLLTVRTRKLSIFQRGLFCGGKDSNPVLCFGLVFETLLAFVLIYVPGVNSGLQMAMVYPLNWLVPLAFVILMVTYDEIRKAIIRKYPEGWMERETCF